MSYDDVIETLEDLKENHQESEIRTALDHAADIVRRWRDLFHDSGSDQV